MNTPVQQPMWEQALERARLGGWDWNLRTGECHYSRTWFEMLGYARDELEQDSELWLRFTHPDDRERAIASGARHIAGETEAIETELRLRHKDGHWIWVLDRGGIVERDADGAPVRMVGVQTDISMQKAAEQALEQVNERFNLALRAGETGIWQFDIDTGRSLWDRRTREMFGLPANLGELPDGLWHSFLHPEDRERTERAHNIAPGNKDAFKIRYRIVLADGQVRHVETLAAYVGEAQGSGSIVGTIRDISEEVWVTEALNTEKERLRVTLRSIRDAVISTDTDGTISFANASAMALLARSEAELLGRQLDEVLFPHTQVPLAAIVKDAGRSEVTTLDRGVGGHAAFRCTASAMQSATGQALGTVFTLQDVTAEQQHQRALSHAARHDPLTGLLNRAAFDGVLTDRIAVADAHPLAVFYIDLDYFKGLNDYAGHAAGDAALRAIGKQLQLCLPAAAAIARLGGDEFAVALPLVDNGDAETVAAIILAAVRSVDHGAAAGYRQLGASIGVALIHDSQTLSADALAFADDACYAAKSSGRNRFELFSRAGSAFSSGLTAARIVADLADARSDGRLLLYGQEIRDLSDPWHSSGYVEILARLRTRDGKMIAPGEFIPAAERFGMAAPLDHWIIRTALTQYGAIMRGSTGLTLGFNLSAQTLSDPRLWGTIDAQITQTGASPANIVFEITETAAFTNFEAAERFVRSARSRGCRVSLDDFGTGLSSFEYLRRFPVDNIKIDGAFIQNLASHQFDREIVKAISGIAHNLGYTVVAEKIEIPEVITILDEMGVKYGQGFLMHRPEPLDRLVARMFGAYGTARRQPR